MVNNVELRGSTTVPIETEEFDRMHPRCKRPQRGSSSCKPNQRANNHNGYNDLLSLPKDILVEILGFLEVRQLVQFNIVAKQFRYCSKYGKRLDFDLSFQKALLDMDQYQPIVGRIMDQHDGSKIQSLKLCFTPANNVENQAMVAQWIEKATQKGVEEVELNFDHSLEPFRVTLDILFQSKTLEALYLVFVDLGSPTKDFQVTGLRFLKLCLMKKLKINVVILDAMLDSCTELVALEIIDCHTPDHIRFSARNLTKFRKLKLANCTTLKEITIDAPSLTILHYSGQLIAYNFKNYGNLVDFLLDLKYTRRAYLDRFLLNKLMLNFMRIEVLTTTSLLLEDKQPASLANDGRGGNHSLEQQQQPPKVWTLALMSLASRTPAPSYPHLQQLKLTGFRFKPREIELLSYFLRSANNLKTVAIFLASPCHWRFAAPNEVVFNYDLKPIIASPRAWIKIYQHKHENEFYPAKHPKNWRKG
ncbi:FBD-associated F-box protein At1g61320 [Linum grandiflorum]